MKISDIDVDIPLDVDKKHLVRTIRTFADSDMYQYGLVLYRGTNSERSWLYSVPKSGLRKKPTDTPVKIHDMVNKKAKQELGYTVRNGIFCSQDKDVAKGYGGLSIVIPSTSATFFVHEYVADFTEYIDDVLDGSNDFKGYLYDHHNIDNINSLSTEKITRLFDEYVEDYIVADYVSNLYQFNMTDMIDTGAEISTFGDMYIIPVNVLRKIFETLSIEVKF